ncbi:MAG TPA: DUF3102 domain-containing protein [Steroidobacteraceae bacterium]|jgi:hypothetical protein|nr:DUF3102 domain-containing protein [Steroidobacteraceae bacterium]
MRAHSAAPDAGYIGAAGSSTGNAADNIITSSVTRNLLSPAYRETEKFATAKKAAAKERRNLRHASDGDTSRREAVKALIPVSNLDVSSEGIGALFKKARASYVDTTNLLIECGQRLREKRKSVPHGQWLTWIEANQESLGFGEDTAQRLMKAAAADTASTRYLDADDAIKLNRVIWGNTHKAEPKPTQAAPTTCGRDPRMVIEKLDQLARIFREYTPEEIARVVESEARKALLIEIDDTIPVWLNGLGTLLRQAT